MVNAMNTQVILAATEVTWSDTWTVVFAGLTFGVLLVGLIFAWGQLHSAERLRKAQTQPHVVAYLEVVAGILMEIVVTNVGSTAAKNVRLAFDPLLERAIDEGTDRKPMFEWSVFHRGISTLPPGHQVRMLFDRGPNRFDLGLPLIHTVTIDCDDYEGNPLDQVEYVLDIEMYRDIHQIRLNTIHDVATELKDLRKDLKSAGRQQMPPPFFQ
jgi:hypothetical protein